MQNYCVLLLRTGVYTRFVTFLTAYPVQINAAISNTEQMNCQLVVNVLDHCVPKTIKFSTGEVINKAFVVRKFCTYFLLYHFIDRYFYDNYFLH